MDNKKTAGCGTFIIGWIISAIILTLIFNAINKTGQSSGNIIFSSVFIGFLFAVVIFSIKMIIITNKNQAALRERNQNDRKNDILRYSSVIHVGGLPAPENITSSVTLSPTELIVICGGNEFSLPIHKIRNVDFQIDIDETQILKSSFVKGAVGAATFGVAGAVIGSAPKTKTKRETKCYAIITYENSEDEYKTFVLRDELPNARQCAMLVDTLKPRINTQVKKVEL